MDDISGLAKKIDELSKRLIALEDRVNNTSSSDDQIWMDELYKKAHELVIKHNKVSPILLQKRLWIDFERAQQLIDMLRKNGVIGKAEGGESSRILG